MKVQHKNRSCRVEVTPDGNGLVSQAGTLLLAEVADRTGLTAALSAGLSDVRERRSAHDPGRVVRDLAVTVAAGGEALTDLGSLRSQEPLFGSVASDATAFRVIEKISRDPELLGAVWDARVKAREHVWDQGTRPGRVTIDIDASLVNSHSEKEGAAGNFKGGFGFHPMLAFIDETSEAAAAVLRPGNAGANTALDQIQVAETALAQVPGRGENGPEVLLRADSAGAVHDLLNWARDSKVSFSVGFDLTAPVREAISQVPDRDWVPARNQDGKTRKNGEVTEITGMVDLTAWPEGSRVIVRRERPHPGAQLKFTDDNGHRFQAILTDQAGTDITMLERRHRARARAENQIADMKDTGLTNLPFRDFEMNQVWLEIVMIAHDLLAWTKSLTLDGELALTRPKRIRHRLLHVAARLAFHSRTAKLRLQADWPWATQLTAAFKKLRQIPLPAG